MTTSGTCELGDWRCCDLSAPITASSSLSGRCSVLSTAVSSDAVGASLPEPDGEAGSDRSRIVSGLRNCPDTNSAPVSSWLGRCDKSESLKNEEDNSAVRSRTPIEEYCTGSVLSLVSSWWIISWIDMPHLERHGQPDGCMIDWAD